MADDRPYTDSVVVTATARAVVPFVLTFGAYTMLHGTTSVGGGFQGGVLVAAAVVTLAFAFGTDQTARALPTRTLVAVASVGLLAFAAVAVATLAVDHPFLDVGAYADLPVPKAAVYAVELVEVGIGVTVAGVATLLYLVLAGAEP